VDVRRVDLSSELQILAYHEQRKSSGQQLDPGLDPVVELAGEGR
jgi:redox-sensing transcriptional repressor